MLIFHKAREGTLEIEGLKAIASTCDVAKKGVKGAKELPLMWKRSSAHLVP